MSISLRGWPGSSGSDDYVLSASQDIARVLTWIRGHQNVSGIVLVGFSLGGLAAALAAADQEPGQLAGLTVVNAPTDLTSFYEENAYGGGVRRYLDATLTPEQWRGSSPLERARSLVHPMLVVTGADDAMTPPDQGRRLAHAAPNATLLEVGHMGHHPSPSD